MFQISSRTATWYTGRQRPTVQTNESAALNGTDKKKWVFLSERNGNSFQQLHTQLTYTIDITPVGTSASQGHPRWSIYDPCESREHCLCDQSPASAAVNPKSAPVLVGTAAGGPPGERVGMWTLPQTFFFFFMVMMAK